MNQVSSIDQQILYIGTRLSKWIDIDSEYDAIHNIVDGTNSQFVATYRPVWRVDQVSSAIQNRRTPTQIIHISGEGIEDGKMEFPDPDDINKGEVLKPEALAQFFEDAKDVNCVLLNFCYSEQAANLIAKHVKCVIGINGDIESTAAVNFSKAFYDFLEGEPLDQSRVDKAFSRGQAAAFAIGDQNKYIKLPLPKPEPEMQIMEPTEGSTVRYPCECKGTFNNLHEGASMWAYVNATIEGKFYLVLIRNYPARSADGEWQVPLYIGPPEGDDDDYRIGVLMVDPKTTPGLRSEYDKAIKELKYFALDSLPTSGTSTFGDRVVKRQ